MSLSSTTRKLSGRRIAKLSSSLAEGLGGVLPSKRSPCSLESEKGSPVARAPFSEFGSFDPRGVGSLGLSMARVICSAISDSGSIRYRCFEGDFREE